MEALAAIASFVAIGQAIAALPKIAESLKAFSKAESELTNLAEEIERMNAYYEYIKINVDLFSNQNVPEPQVVPEPPYLRNLRTDLEKFIRNLQILIESCSKAKGTTSGQLKVSKLRWVRKKGEIVEMRGQCRDLRHQLESAVTPFLLRVQSNHGNLLYELRAYIMNPSRHSMLTLESSEQKNSFIEEPDDMPMRELPQPESDLDSTPKPVRDHRPHPGTYHNPPLWGPSRQLCSCSCHALVCLSTSRVGHYSLASGISFSYMRNVVSKDGVCRKCTCFRPRPALKIEFRCPTWRWHGALLGSVSYGASTGISASLRPAILVAVFDPIWDYIHFNDFRRFRQRIDILGLSLTDTAQLFGETIFERALIGMDTSLFSRFPQDRLKILAGTAASLKGAWIARRQLHKPRSTLSDELVHFLKRIIDIADEDDEIKITMSNIFELISNPQDLVKELHQNPDLTHFTGPTGETLLHIACSYGDKKVVEILLNQGFDKDAQNHLQRTPLASAIEYHSLDCAHLLLDYGCSVNMGEPWPESSFHTLMNEDPNTNLLQRLLENGLSFGISKPTRDTVLHNITELPLNFGMECKLLEVISHFGGHSLMETKNRYGQTPLLRAILMRNSGMTKLYITAGADINVKNNFGANALQYAAQYLDKSVIKVLTETGIDRIDIRTKDDDGHTPLSDFWYQRLRMSPPNPRWTRPGGEETRAFEALLRNVRDRVIKIELGKLHTIITMIKEGKSPQAREELRQLAQVKTDARIEWEAETFRTIELQIKQGMLEPAIESLEEFMKVSQARMRVSPVYEPDVDPWFFKYHCQYIFPWFSDQHCPVIEDTNGENGEDEESEWCTTSGSESEEWSEEED